MVIFIIGNPETTGTARVFHGETALQCAEKALSVLPSVIVKNGKFFTELGEDRADSRAWALIDGAQ